MTLLLLLIAMTAVALIGVSPIALGVFNGGTDHWERLSFIGQTYGAASAVISVLALVGIVATLSYQAREVKLSREEARRQAIGDLLPPVMVQVEPQRVRDQLRRGDRPPALMFRVRRGNFPSRGSLGEGPPWAGH
ncbi:MAG: DUF6082 family protein [Actinoallomurus sp.]